MDKLTLKWDAGILNKLIGLTYKKNQHITIFNLRNLQKLLYASDFSQYINKAMIIRRVDFLKRSLEARLDHKFTDESIIINYAMEDTADFVIYIPNIDDHFAGSLSGQSTGDLISDEWFSAPGHTNCLWWQLRGSGERWQAANDL